MMPDSPINIDPRDRAAIDTFLEGVWSRDGLADLTLTDYRGDLERCATWLAEHAHGLLRATREDLFRYLAARNAAGIGARTNARELTALRRFYGEQVRRDVSFEDPTLLLDTPNCHARCPRRWRSARSKACWKRRTLRRRSACAIAQCWN